MKSTKYENREDGVYLDGEKVAHVVAGTGHVRMASGKSDMRDEVVAFLATNPKEAKPNNDGGYTVESNQGAGDPPSGAGDSDDKSDNSEDEAPPAPVADENKAPASTPSAPSPFGKSGPGKDATASKASKPTPQTAESEVPPKPQASPLKGDKDPAVIAWYREHHPEEFKRRYAGCKFPT